MGPAGTRQRKGREGAETDWEAVPESEMKDAVTLADKASVSTIDHTKAASNVEEESVCMHSDAPENISDESIGLANTKKTPVNSPKQITSSTKQLGGGAEEFLMTPGPRPSSSRARMHGDAPRTPLAPRSPTPSARACTDREDEEEEEQQQ